MPEITLDEEQREKAIANAKKSLNVKPNELAKNLKRKLQEMIDSYQDGDEPMDAKDAEQLSLVTEAEYKAILNPPQPQPKNPSLKSKKQKKEQIQDIQHAKKAKEEHVSKLRKEAEDGVFTFNHPKQAHQRRDFTVSVAIPGSVIERMESFKLKTYVAGQIARICGMYRIDEVVVYNEHAKPITERNLYLANMVPEKIDLLKHAQLEKDVVQKIKEREAFADSQKKSWAEQKKEQQVDQEEAKKNAQASAATPSVVVANNERTILKVKDDNVFLANILYFLETPPYLRGLIFPLADFLREAAVLYPLATPHHQASSVVLKYREGVVTNDRNMVYVGLPKLVAIDEKLKPGTRVTVYLDRTYSYYYYGQLLQHRAPKLFDGLYWGYNVRLADSLGAVWSECPYKGGYDASLGTSEKGENIQNPNFKIPRFKHLLIVFGGFEGIEKCIANDPRIKNKSPAELFSKYVNVLPTQGVQSIRTEEALACALGALNKNLDANIPPPVSGAKLQQQEDAPLVEDADAQLDE